MGGPLIEVVPESLQCPAKSRNLIKPVHTNSVNQILPLMARGSWVNLMKGLSSKALYVGCDDAIAAGNQPPEAAASSKPRNPRFY